MKLAKLLLIFLLSFIGLGQRSFATEGGLPPGVTLQTLDQIKFEKSASGRDFAFILGNTNQPGPYLNLVKWAPNDKALPHKHPDSRYGVVLSGVHYIGYGDKFDESKLHKHAAGTFFTEPANTPHFGMTKDEGAILYFYGTGPSSVIPIE